VQVELENPAGILNATISARMAAGAVHVEGAAYRRNAQILVRGYAPLYRASPELTRALLA
jgi:4-oxalomesaconate tautomerase